MTDPGEYAYLYDELPDDFEQLFQVIHGVLLHAHDARDLYDPTSVQPKEQFLRTMKQRLVDAGNTVIVIEHNLDVIRSADWVIDLGPEGGDEGGTVVAQGTPQDVATVEASYTGQFLKAVFAAIWPSSRT